MAPTITPEVISRLKNQLMISQLQSKDPPLFQVINQLIGLVQGIGNSVTNNSNVTPVTPIISNTFIFDNDNSSSSDNNNAIAIPGLNGINGKDGINIPGTDGLDGEDGIPIVGLTGATGPVGPQGIQGLPGVTILNEDGSDGDIGPIGPIGLTGPSGSNGTNGSNGIMGPSGEDGLDGFDAYIQLNSSSGIIPLFTSGSVIFAGVTGLLTEDNSKFFWDDTNFRLGLRTTTPSGLLHLKGGADVTQLIIQANATQTSALEEWLDSSNNVIGKIDSNGNIYIGSQPAITGGTGVLTLRDGSTKSFTITSNDTATDLQTQGSTPLRLQGGGGGQVYTGTDLNVGLSATDTINAGSLNLSDGTHSVFISVNTTGPFINLTGSKPLFINNQGALGNTLIISALTAIGNAWTATDTVGPTLTIYDKTASSGITHVIIQEGAGQSNNEVFGIYANDGTTPRVVVKNSQVGIGIATPDSKAILDLTSTTLGLLPPRLTTTQKLAISSPTNGLRIFDSTLNQPQTYNGNFWENMGEVGVYNPNESIALATGQYLIKSNHIQFVSTQRYTGTGTSRLRITT